MHSNCAHRARPVSRGFTLVEMLVVIGVIAMLVAMLVPTMRKARTAASQLQCQSNIRQINVAVRLYADSSRGWLPYSSIVPRRGSNPADQWTWWERISGIAPGSAELIPWKPNQPSQVWYCPLAIDTLASTYASMSSFDTNNGTGKFYAHFGMNAYLLPLARNRNASGTINWRGYGAPNFSSGQPVRITSLPRPNELALLADASPGTMNTTAPTGFVQAFNHNGTRDWGTNVTGGVMAPWPIRRNVAVNNRQSGQVTPELHGGTVTIAYLDGHVGSLTSLREEDIRPDLSAVRQRPLP